MPGVSASVLESWAGSRKMHDTDKPYTMTFDDESGVLRVSWPPGSKCTGPAAVAQIAETDALGVALPVPLLVEMPKLGGMTRDARETFVASNHRFTKVALLTDSAVSTMIANFFISTRPVPTPIRTFTSESDALVWLTAQR